MLAVPLVLMTAKAAERLGCKPLARVVSKSSCILNSITLMDPLAFQTNIVLSPFVSSTPSLCSICGCSHCSHRLSHGSSLCHTQSLRTVWCQQARCCNVGDQRGIQCCGARKHENAGPGPSQSEHTRWSC